MNKGKNDFRYINDTKLVDTTISIRINIIFDIFVRLKDLIDIITYSFEKNPNKGGIPIREKIVIILFFSINELKFFILNFLIISIKLNVKIK